MRVCPQCRLIYQSAGFELCGIHGVRLVEQDRDPLVGTSLDRYEILEVLSSGAMGRVYRARHSVLGRMAAIKVLFGDHACEENFRLRFEREAQAVAKMRHRNIVSVTDFGTVEGLPFLVMDHLHGVTLEHVIDEQAPFTPARAAHILRQIASGLEEAHRNGFVHRDMKPANVMIVGTGPNEEALILDFGVVSMISTSIEGDNRLTTEGQLIGTPMYMSPEQTMDPNVSASSDIYSAGVILYEMLTGRPPFLADGRMMMMVAHISEPPPPLTDCGGLEKLALWMLEKDPKDRPASASEVIAEIDRLEERWNSRWIPTERLPRLDGLPTVEFPAPGPDQIEGGKRSWSPPKPKRAAQELLPVLVLESDHDLAIEIERRLDEHLFRVHHAQRLDAGIKILEHERISAVVLDLSLPDCEGLETIDRVRAKAPETPIVVVSKLGHEWLAIEAIRRGADDYLTCSVEELRRLQRSIHFGMERRARPATAPPSAIQAMAAPSNEPPPEVGLGRSRASSLVLGAILFAIGLAAGAFLFEPNHRAVNLIGSPRAVESSTPSR